MTSQVTEMTSYPRQLFRNQLIGATLLLFYTLLAILPLNAQEYCGVMQTSTPCIIPPLTIHEIETSDCKSVAEGDFVIPVVFHIMYNNPLGPENVSDEQVYQALDDLNMRFAKDEGGTSFNQQIRFELAHFDPDENCTNGINHVQVDAQFSAGIVHDNWDSGSQEAAYKNQSNWDNVDHKYMNVWIVNNIIACGGGPGPGGYSSFPFSLSSSNHIVDGMVVQYEFLSTITFAHEVGHFLGLYHVFGVDPANSCLTNPLACPYGDGVDDTAPVTGTEISTACPGYTYPITNIMSGGNARIAFTAGQVDRVCHWLSTNRHDLVSNENLFNTLGTFDFPIEHITQNTTWSTFRKQNKTVVLSNGAVLTITAEVRFGTTVKVVVEPGSGLVLNNALLTVDNFEACPNATQFMWGGIEVQGVSSESQTSGDQGTATIINSTIEHAITAVRLYGPTSGDTGGQLHAAISTFRNNITGVKINSYDDDNANYKAKFLSCSFITDNNYQGYSPPYAGVDMEGIQGVRFERCTFMNSNTSYSNVYEYGYGIKAVSAGFKVYPQIKLGQKYPSRFEGLYIGISAGTVGQNREYEVNHTEFKSCAFGIHNSMVSEATMLYNDFDMGELPGGITQGDQFGIFLEGGIDGLDIENNEFKCNPVGFGGCPLSQIVTTGVLASNLGDYTQAIRGNIFDGIENGIVANGLNTIEGPLGGGTGLHFVCNNNSQITGLDISIGNTVLLDVIRRIQKNGIYPAGNTFSADNPFVGNNFFNEESDPNANQIDYFYYDMGLNEYPADVYQIQRPLMTVVSQCQSDFPDFPGGSVVNVHEPGRVNLLSTKAEFYAQKDTFNQLLVLYNAAVSSENQILIDYYFDLLTIRGSKVDAINQDVLQLVSTDTATYDLNEYMLWIGNIDNYTSDLWRAREYGSRGDTSQANSILNNIGVKWALNPEQQTDFDNILVISGMLERRSIEYFMPSQLDTIRNIANLGLGISSTWARAILSMHGEIVPPYYKLCQGIPQQAPLVTATNTPFDDQTSIVQIAPNPSNGYITFTFAEETVTPFNLDIYNVSGRMVYTTNVQTSEFVWDGSNAQEGIYFYTVRDRDGRSSSGKIIIQR